MSIGTNTGLDRHSLQLVLRMIKPTKRYTLLLPTLCPSYSNVLPTLTSTRYGAQKHSSSSTTPLSHGSKSSKILQRANSHSTTSASAGKAHPTIAASVRNVSGQCSRSTSSGSAAHHSARDLHCLTSTSWVAMSLAQRTGLCGLRISRKRRIY